MRDRHALPGNLVGEDFVYHGRTQVGWPHTKVGAQVFVADGLSFLVDGGDRSYRGHHVFEPTQMLGIKDGDHYCSKFMVADVCTLCVIVALCQSEEIELFLLNYFGNVWSDVSARLRKIGSHERTRCGRKEAGNGCGFAKNASNNVVAQKPRYKARTTFPPR